MFFRPQRIYMDYAASTPVDTRVMAEMQQYWFVDFANPSSLHTEGRAASRAIDDARSQVLQLVNARKTDQLVFSSGGTEANVLAISGTIAAARDRLGLPLDQLTVITSPLEHASVRTCLAAWQEQGLQVVELVVHSDGVVDIDDLKTKLAKSQNVILVTVQYVNSEIGTVQPVAEIAASVAVADGDIVFHCDASQAPMIQSVNVQQLGVDLLTLCGQKILAPKGVGALYVKNGVQLQPTQPGSQEFGLRGGTPPVPLVVGMAAAMQRALRFASGSTDQVAQLRRQLIDQLQTAIAGIEIHGPHEVGSHIVNVTFPTPHTSDQLVIHFDTQGIACSVGAACSAGHSDVSYSVRALGKQPANTVRFSFDPRWQDIDIKRAVEKITQAFAKLV